jgi:23S rRNA (pseudouridine1915-N3)-methyltransferase
MMLGRAAIVCAGKLHEDFLRKGCAEYEKRLTRYLKLTIDEVRDRPDSIPDERALAEEGQDMLRRIAKDDCVIALAIDGRTIDSPQLSRFLVEKLSCGNRAVFAIGSSRGLSPDVLARADARLSFSPMTFPHGLARLMLLEQLYRACRIASGEAYHK